MLNQITKQTSNNRRSIATKPCDTQNALLFCILFFWLLNMIYKKLCPAYYSHRMINSKIRP